MADCFQNDDDPSKGRDYVTISISIFVKCGSAGFSQIRSHILAIVLTAHSKL